MNKKPVMLILLAFLSWNLAQAAHQAAARPEITVIEGATVIDGVSNVPIQDAVLVIEGDVIRSIGKRGNVGIPAGARTIQATGKTIMPAILGLHGHLGMTEGWDRKPELYTRERIQRDANAYLYYGVTHSVSLGLDWAPMWGLRADQRAGRAGGARMYSASLGFSAKGGWEPAGVKEINRPTSPEEARVLVRKEMANKPDVLKIWLDDRQGELPKLLPEVYGAIIDEAHKHNVKVLAHLFTLEDAKELMRRGVDALAHSVRDKEVDAEFLELAKDKRITQILTLGSNYSALAFAEGATYLEDPGLPLLFPATVLDRLRSKEYQQERTAGLERARAQWQMVARSTARIAAAGIAIAVGTDSGGSGSFPGLWEHREMELLVKVGLTPMQAIQAATINGARFLRVDSRYGTLQPGKVADFILLAADPLSDITNSRKIDAVWMNGKPVDRATLGLRRTSSN